MIVMLKFDWRIKLISIKRGVVIFREIWGSNKVNGIDFNIENNKIFCFLKWLVSGFLKNVLNIFVIINKKM